MLPDYRAVSLYSTQDGSPYRISTGFTGVGLLPVDATTLPRPSEAHIWSGATWVLDALVDARLRKERAIRERATRLSSARDAMEPLDIAVELGEATQAEAAQLLAWKRYIVAVNRVDVSAAEIQWPEVPTA
ncbi:tail fiber assembly protein [Ralstonia mojiangensis]|uniref:tail fiber assembly protein n=1 Tax=Ralstonia mojiangensis TaxID=2953895 RepID=UPI002090CD91|nr:tail fiber assembly protein [Ralstonia mojiangensis]MCO5412844.1 tail fiber assembly protein [Ralstonia mojiangensis]